MKKTIVRYRHTIFVLIMIVLNGVGALASTPWTVNPHDYRYDMSLYLDVVGSESMMDYSLYDVGVFCGDECRGVAEELPLGNGKSCLYVRVRSNQESGETMTFKLYNRDTKEITSIEGTSFLFESNGKLGYPSDPYIVNMTTTFNVQISAGIGGSVSQSGGIITQGSELILNAIPNEGYHFVGWSDGSTDNPRTILIDKDIILSAEFALNKYSLIYMVDGETYREYTLEYGSTITPEAEPEKEGYTFSGWDNVPETMPAHDVTVSGTFSINSYKAVFKIDSEIVETKTIEFGQPVVAPDTPVKEGYTFAGWQDVPETMPAHDIEILGSYTINGYKLTYTVDGETYKEYTLEYGSAITPEKEPEKEGHTFSGWDNVPKTMPAYDVTVSGTFSINSYKAVFKIDSEVVETKTIEFGQPVVTPDAPVKEGHIFAGWQGVPEYMPAHDIEIIGSYTINGYKLTYKVDGETYREYTFEYGSAITPEAEPEKEGHSFSGWDNVPETMPAYDVTVSGTFSINSYKAIFKIDGEVVETKTIEFRQPVVAPDAPVKEGYTFSGWQDVPETMPAHDIEIAGFYSVNLYKLTIYLNDEMYSSEDVEYGTSLALEEPTVPDGMKFDGWLTDIPEIMPANDLDIYGTYSEINSVGSINISGNDKVTIFTIDGVLICKNMSWDEAKDKLEKGIYVINGNKVFIH